MELTRCVIIEAGRSDAVFVRARKEGLDEATVAYLKQVLEKPEAVSLRQRVGGRYATLPELFTAIAELADPSAAPSPMEFDVLWLAECATSLCDRGQAMARALLGLAALAIVEGLARKHRPSPFPWFSLDTIRRISLPAARSLASCGASWSAGVLARLQREYIVSDPYQRASADGKALVAELRAVEAGSDRRLREDCQEVAWLLHEDFEKYRIWVACLFFATGDVVRAFAIAGKEQHKPSLRVLRDLVEFSVQMSTVDPLLQAVWLITLGETKIPVPDDIRFVLRRVAPEVLPQFKGGDQTTRKHFGVSISQAYAEGVLHFLGKLWDSSILDAQWWKVLKTAIELPLFQSFYASGFLRLLELVSLALEPGEPLPSSDYISGMAGYPAELTTDIRISATISLQMDRWTSRQAQLGRSIAYDSAFYIEPWRRQESAADSLDFWEHYRCSSLIYWLTVIPPLCARPLDEQQRRILEEDAELMRAYRSIAHLTAMETWPMYLSMYGGPDFKKRLRLKRNYLVQYHIDIDEKYSAFRKEARKVFPSYAERRFPTAGIIDEVRKVVGIG
jgi:hypothetical protein